MDGFDLIIGLVSALAGYISHHFVHHCRVEHSIERVVEQVTVPVEVRPEPEPVTSHRRVLVTFKFNNGTVHRKRLFEHSLRDPILWNRKKFALITRDADTATFGEIE